MVERRPVRGLRGPFPIVQDLADPAVDHRRVRVQRLDVPEERRRIPEETRGPAWPIARSSLSMGAFRLATSKMRALGLIAAIRFRMSAHTDIGTETATTLAARTPFARSGSNGKSSSGPAMSFTTTSYPRDRK